MGVKGLAEIIKKYGAKAVTEHVLADYAGQTVAIDMSIYMYKWSSVKILGDLAPLMGLMNQLIKMKRVLVTPIYVFDGPPADGKEATIAARKAVPGALKVPRAAWKDVWDFLELMGVAAQRASGDAERLAAQFDVPVFTEDSDFLAFAAGAQRPAKMVRMESRGRFLEIDLDVLIDECISRPRLPKVSKSTFVDMCINLGTDYNDRTPGFGPVTAVDAARTGNMPPVDEKIKEYFSSPGTVIEELPRGLPAGRATVKEFLLERGVTSKRADKFIGDYFE